MGSLAQAVLLMALLLAHWRPGESGPAVNLFEALRRTARRQGIVDQPAVLQGPAPGLGAAPGKPASLHRVPALAVFSRWCLLPSAAAFQVHVSSVGPPRHRKHASSTLDRTRGHRDTRTGSCHCQAHCQRSSAAVALLSCINAYAPIVVYTARVAVIRVAPPVALRDTYNATHFCPFTQVSTRCSTAQLLLFLDIQLQP
jgi:hypothetical protein